MGLGGWHKLSKGALQILHLLAIFLFFALRWDVPYTGLETAFDSESPMVTFSCFSSFLLLKLLLFCFAAEWFSSMLRWHCAAVRKHALCLRSCVCYADTFCGWPTAAIFQIDQSIFPYYPTASILKYITSCYRAFLDESLLYDRDMTLMLLTC